MRRSKSEEALCRLLITMAEETFDKRKSLTRLWSLNDLWRIHYIDSMPIECFAEKFIIC